MPGGHARVRDEPSDLGTNSGERSITNDVESNRHGISQRLMDFASSEKADTDPLLPPDGGWRAWSQCLAGHLLTTNAWGWINSFGVIQTLYADMLEGQSASSISWIGSTTVFLLFFMGTVSGRLVDAGYLKPVIALGGALQVFGLAMASLGRSYWQLFLAQGVCVGLGNGLVFTASMALVSTYFEKRRALAMAVTTCGTATGGLVFPSMARQLLPQVGFGWTMRAIALVQLVNVAVSVALVRPRVRPRQAGHVVDLAAFKEVEYTLYTTGTFLAMLGLLFAFFYLAEFARNGLDNESSLSFSASLDLLLIINGVGIPSRLVCNYIGDRVGAVNMIIPVTALCSLVMFCWTGVGSAAGLYAWSVAYGLLAAAYQSLLMPALAAVSGNDLNKLGVRMGMALSVVSLAVLTGSPIAGAIVGSAEGYQGAQAFAGSSMGAGCILIAASKAAKMRKTGQSWKEKL